MRVTFHYEAGPALAAQLAALEDVTVETCAEADEARFAVLLPRTEVLWHVLKPVTSAHMDAAPSLKLIQKIGVGVNTIDVEAAKARGIAVCNLPGTNSPAVAEMTLLLMLGALRQAARFDAATRAGGGWAQPPAVQDGLRELGGLAVGLVGAGAVPQALAPVLRSLGCRVLYTATAPKPDGPGEFRSLDALLVESDLVSLHAPLTPATRHMIGAAAIARMKPGAVLVNTARGGLVDTAALAAALASGRLSAAGIDVFEEEPVASGNPLLSLPNVLLAPHIAWLTTGTFARSFALAAENCRRLRDGAALLHRVA
ncbi:2-hydroxyacid dehydrogenase [Plastoroseomonas hellenica]|uniref:2-hydroxyacid dehydrogenase n=1 Tax=Plastoroseomonas hellenica TaxID=2687306 RepID=UPI001BA865F6|nr:2-hydroxyacid dehydrogenase [Plastoroseomonas hellenica]MBR0643299.1 hydroxyacid dehydrogenase [Plastoroseomonas hellenica]